MNKHMRDVVSRPIGVAESLLKTSVDPAVVYEKQVILMGEESTLATQNGRWCFYDALRLVSRISGRVLVSVPAGVNDLYEEVVRFCRGAWCLGSLEVVREIPPAAFQSADAVLNVGSEVRPELPWTAINCNGWVARVSSGLTSLGRDCSQSNPLSALMAASFGATEVFKRLFAVPADIAPLIGYCEFSLFELTVTPNGAGPALPETIILPDTLMVGGGAIGNGIALILSQLPVQGRLHLVDKQDFADENFATCVLLRKEGWLGRSKAIRLAAWLNERTCLKATGECDLIEGAMSKAHIESMRIDLVLNGLDDVDARRVPQRLWPSTLVDGGINEVGAAVIQHRLDRPDLACLQCWFEAVPVDEKTQQSKWTGLHATSLGNLDRLLTEEDISAASKDKQQWLRECYRKGKSVCSIITEAQLAARLGLQAQEGFRPSVPFVATAAAALVVSEALKAMLFPDAPYGSLFQLGSLFLGPDASVRVKRAPTPSCACVVHRSLIERVRMQRRREPQS